MTYYDYQTVTGTPLSALAYKVQELSKSGWSICSPVVKECGGWVCIMHKVRP